jgi:hypothetical protein
MLARHGAPTIFKLCFADFFRVRSAITFGARCIGAPLVLADYKEDDGVWCFYVTLKSEQTSIATV